MHQPWHPNLAALLDGQQQHCRESLMSVLHAPPCARRRLTGRKVKPVLHGHQGAGTCLGASAPSQVQTPHHSSQDVLWLHAAAR